MNLEAVGGGNDKIRPKIITVKSQVKLSRSASFSPPQKKKLQKTNKLFTGRKVSHMGRLKVKTLCIACPSITIRLCLITNR